MTVITVVPVSEPVLELIDRSTVGVVGTDVDAEKLTLSIASPSSFPASLESDQRSHRVCPGCQEMPVIVELREV